MIKRDIIKIDEERCNGCRLCIPNCPEGALQIIDGKARLISDLFCDGWGACIGHCPQGAISIEKRDSGEYDERTVMGNIIKQGKNVIKAHLEHLKEHNQTEYLNQAIDFLKEKKIENPLKEETVHGKYKHTHEGCPGSEIMDFRKTGGILEEKKELKMESQLRQWPVQITLVPPFAPYLDNSDLLISADCVPFAYADFHRNLLDGKTLLVGCPKLDDIESYKERITEIVKDNSIKSITYAHMEVPCCFGLVGVIQKAISESGKDIPFKEVTISVGGEKLNDS